MKYKKVLVIIIILTIPFACSYWYMNRLYMKEKHYVKVHYDESGDCIVIENQLENTRFYNLGCPSREFSSLNERIPETVLPEKYYRGFVPGSICTTMMNDSTQNVIITDKLELSEIRGSLKDGTYEFVVNLVELADNDMVHHIETYTDRFIVEKYNDTLLIRILKGRNHSKGLIYETLEYQFR